MRFDTSGHNKSTVGGSGVEMGILGAKPVIFGIPIFRFDALLMQLPQ